MIEDFVDGVVSYFRILPLIRKYKLFNYLIITGVLSLLIGAAAIYFTYRYADNLGDWVVSKYPWQFGQELFSKLASWLAAIIFVVIFLFIYKYVILIAVAPFMSLLSESIENKIVQDSGQINFSLKRAIKETIRGIRIALRNLFRELGYTLILLILGFFPFMALVSGPAILIVQAYYAGFGNMDFYLERHLNVRESANFVREYKGLAIGNGFIFLTVLMIPVIGLFIAPAFGTAAATVESIKRLEDVED